MSSEFKLVSEHKDNCLIMATFGYINNVGGEQIAGEFKNYQSKGIQKVILDLANSNVVNSIGISYLIEIIEILNESEGKLIFTNMDPSIEKTFNIMGLFHFAEKAENVEDALKNNV